MPRCCCFFVAHILKGGEGRKGENNDRFCCRLPKKKNPNNLHTQNTACAYYHGALQHCNAWSMALAFQKVSSSSSVASRVARWREKKTGSTIITVVTAQRNEKILSANKTGTCSNCHWQFLSVSLSRRHLATLTSPPPLLCPHCSFTSRSAAQRRSWWNLLLDSGQKKGGGEERKQPPFLFHWASRSKNGLVVLVALPLYMPYIYMKLP